MTSKSADRKAEATPKARRTKTPPPTLTEMCEAVKVRRQGLDEFKKLLIELDNITSGKVVPRNGEEVDALRKTKKENAKNRRTVKASIRRANKVIARYERTLASR